MTTSTIAQVIDRLAELQEAVDGVKNAYGHNQNPDALKAAMLPAFLTVQGRGEPFYQTYGRTAAIEVRDFRMLLYVCPVTQPSDVAKQADRVEPFHDRVRAKFQTDLDLSGLTITDSEFKGDNGLEVLEYAGEFYAGIEFTITITRQL